MSTEDRKYDSEESTTEDNAKKRQASFEIFGRSKKITRSPPKKTPRAGDEMEELNKMMRQMLTEIKDIKTGQQIYENEIKILKEENKTLKDKIVALEDRVNLIEKRDRKNNIILKGINLDGKDAKTELETFFKNKLEVNVTIDTAEVIKPKLAQAFVKVKMNTWQDKINIMRAKNKLKGTNNYIDDDLNQQEQKMQASLREYAKQERGRGKEAKVGYGRIYINRERWDWDQQKEEIVKNDRFLVPKN